MDGTLYKTDRDGNPNVFNMNRNADGLWLNTNNAKPSNRWNSNNEFVFRLRKYILFRAIKRGFSFRDSLSYFSNHQTFYLSHRA